MALWQRGAFELGRMIRDREVSSREVVDAHIARIEAVNGTVNAVTRLIDGAERLADEADRSEPAGPLHGVPFSIKENIDVFGTPTTQGVVPLVEAMPTTDAPIVRRLREAGAIPLARTNCPEFAVRIDTVNPLHGRTYNPWNEAVTAGGSSGGEGAAIACGMSPLGLGNDIGGSVRNPAFCNGITALKPTPGRLPHVTSIEPMDWGLSFQLMAVEGPMARHVADLARAFELLAGSDIGDPDSVDVPLTGPPAADKVALVTEVPGAGLPESAIAAVRHAGAALTDAGWQVEEVLPPELEAVHHIWGVVLSHEFMTLIETLESTIEPLLAQRLREFVAMFDAPNVPSAVVHAERRRLRRGWSEFFRTCPLIVGPVWTRQQFAHDEDLSAPDFTANTLRFISPANVLGLPAVAVPTGVSDGLPTGVQVYAERFREDLALRCAELIESAVGTITPIDPTF